MVLLSFDIEEFDMPLEYKGTIPFERQISISQTGLERILDILKKHQVKATFFSTVVFAENSKHLIKRLLEEGHELASHTWFHSEFEEKHLKESRERLEDLFSTKVTGLRMPRMMPVDEKAVEKAGYSYNSSINPTFLPGRYNNLKVSRTYFKEGNVTQVPASVSPNFRIPLFWLSFHNFPLSIYKKLASDSLKKDDYLNVYFHPWEFAEIKDEAFKLPGFTVKNSGMDMVKRFDKFIGWLKNKKYSFGTFQEFQKKDRIMKIAFDAKRFFHNTSGLGNYSRDLVRILSHYFPENTYLLLNKNKSERGADILVKPDVHFVETSKGSMSRQLKMGKDAQKQDADIFHGLSGELPLQWEKTPIKKVVTIHDLIFMRYPQYYSFFDRKIHLWKFKKAAQNADRIIAISEQTKRDIIQYLKVPEDKIEVIYQGCHQAFKEEQPSELIHATQEKFNLPERFILNVGTIEPRKNLLNIVKAIKDTNIPLVVVGRKTKYYKKVEAFIRKNKMEKQVYFLEGVSMDELAILYKLADIFVYPSFFEGFGIPVIEALFSKTVTITSNTSCLPEAGGKDSVYVNPENELDIRSKIQFLWDNESERKRRSDKSFEFVQKFNDEPIANELMNFYQKIFEKIFDI